MTILRAPDAQEAGLSELLARPYETVVRKKDGRFLLIVPDLSLAVSGKDLADAFADLERRKLEYFAEMIAFEAEDAIPAPSSGRLRSRFREEMFLFAAKSVVVATALGLALALGGAVAARKLQSLSAAALIKQNVNALAAETERWNASSDEVKRQRADKLREIADSLRPLLDALSPAPSGKTRGSEASDR